MITLTNSLHGTSATIRAKGGDEVSVATLGRVRRALCGISDCRCSGEDGTRGGRYGLAVTGTNIVVVDNQQNRSY